MSVQETVGQQTGPCRGGEGAGSHPAAAEYAKSGVVIYPSLHYIVYSTDLPKAGAGTGSGGDSPAAPQKGGGESVTSEEKGAEKKTGDGEAAKDRYEKYPIGDENLSYLLPPDCYAGDVVLIAGERATFKQTLAVNFLVSGLTKAEKGGEKERGGSGLLIRFHDRPGFTPRGMRLRQGLVRPKLKLISAEDMSIPSHPTKYKATVYEEEDTKNRLIELAFKSGNILPEEFLHHVRHVIRVHQAGHPIRRMVLSEVGQIGVSYPFLKRSRTAGELFLSALIHTLRNYPEISLLMTGTTDQYEEADRMIDRARTLADAVLTCSRCDVFGNRLIVVDGERLTVGVADGSIQREYGEYVPAVIVPSDRGEFHVDPHRLDGLVGFETGQIVRPGLICWLLEEGDIQKRYNRSISHILPHTFGSPVNAAVREDSAKAGVQVVDYGSTDSAVVFESLEWTRDRPLQQTVVAAIDEFCLAEEELGESAADTGGPTEQGRPICRDSGGRESNLASLAFIDLSKRSSQLGEGGEDDAFMDTIWSGKRSGAEGTESDPPDADAGRKRRWSHAHPYYANVMLLAYRIRDDKGNEIRIDWGDGELDLAERDKEGNGAGNLPWSRSSGQRRATYTWKSLRRFVELIHGQLQDSAGCKGKEGASTEDVANRFRLFDWVDVPETWACILLDAMVNAAYLATDSVKRDPEHSRLFHAVEELLDIPQRVENSDLEEARRRIEDIDRKRGGMLSDLLRGQSELPRIVYERYLIRSLRAAQHLFSTDYGLRDDPDRRRNRLDPRSAAYVCWYSQLRNLIQSHPELANKLDVCALPGGGFRGDWYLGVARGSVSVSLGVELIKTLCRSHEEYRRFSLGVGMPVRAKFYKKDAEYFAWPGGHHVKLAKIQDIHRDAVTRASIPGYRCFRNILQTVCHQVVGKPGEVIPYDDYERLQRTLKRIPKQIAMMMSEPPSRGAH